MDEKRYFDNTNQKKAVLSVWILASSSSKRTVLAFNRMEWAISTGSEDSGKY